MVSTTFSTAAVACRRSEPIFSVSTSMSSALFMQNLRNQWPSLDRLEDTVNPLPTDFQEPRAISGEASELSCPPWPPAEGPENRVEGRRFRLAGAFHHAGKVRGFQSGRPDSYDSISVSFRSVRPISS